MSESIKVENKGLIATYYFIVWVIIPIILYKGIDRLLMFGNIIYRTFEEKARVKDQIQYMGWIYIGDKDYKSQVLYENIHLWFIVVILMLAIILIAVISEYRILKLKKNAVSWSIIILLFHIVVMLFMYYVNKKLYFDPKMYDRYVKDDPKSLVFFVIICSITLVCVIYNKYKDVYKDPFIN